MLKAGPGDRAARHPTNHVYAAPASRSHGSPYKPRHGMSTASARLGRPTHDWAYPQLSLKVNQTRAVRQTHRVNQALQLLLVAAAGGARTVSARQPSTLVAIVISSGLHVATVQYRIKRASATVGLGPGAA